MPQRTNAFQAVVFFVHKHIAADATVEESVMLKDRLTGEACEVDVVITANVAGRDLRIGIECRDQKRPQGVEWVRYAHDTHSRLPINQTVLVSSSGFYRSAYVLAEKLGIELVAPGSDIAADGPLARLGLQVNATQLTWIGDGRLRATFDHEGEEVRVPLEPGTELFASDGQLISDTREFIAVFQEHVMNSGGLDSTDETAKVLGFRMAPPPVQNTKTGEPGTVHLRYADTLKLTSAVKVLEGEIDMEIRNASIDLKYDGLEGVEFATGTGDFDDHRALVVVTEGDGGPRLSMRVTDRDGKNPLDVIDTTVRFTSDDPDTPTIRG